MKRHVATILAAILIIVGCANRAGSETVPLWGRFETELDNDKRYTNPYCGDMERQMAGSLRRRQPLY